MTTVDRQTIAAQHIPESFRAWRQRVVRQGALPVIGVAGSRGKSTVIRMLDAIFSASDLRVATWTDVGIEIRGRRQSSELAAWESCLRRLAGNTLDVVIQELDWPTVNAVGLPASAYPIVVVTNICVNNDRCMLQADTRLAVRAYERVRSAGRTDGVLVLNGDDFAVAGTEIEIDAPVSLFALSPDAPLVRVHLAEGGRAAWAEDRRLVVGSATSAKAVSAQTDLPFALNGLATFQIHNALAALLVAEACGIPPEVSAGVLEAFSIPTSIPGSFNLVTYDQGIAIVDRPTPSWYLRPILRALRQRPQGGTILVCGQLAGIPEDDLVDVGRLLARGSKAIVLHSQDNSTSLSTHLRAGIDQSDRALVVVHSKSERTAIARGLAMMRPGDALLVLADNPTLALRQLTRATGPQDDREFE